MSLANLPRGKRRQPLARRQPAARVRRLAGEALEARQLLATLDRTFLPDNAEPDNQAQFGYRVAASDTQYAVSAPGATIQGQVRGEVFLYDAAGSLVRTFLSSTAATHFGSGLALDGNYMLVGDDALGVGRGSVSLYDVTTGLPMSLSHPVVQPGDRFGAAVALRPNVMAVGAPGVTVSGQVGAGVVHLYDPASPSTTRRTINNPDSETGDAFGSAVAVDGNVALVGAPNDDTGGADAGRAYLFNATTGAVLWVLENPSPAAGDQFGSSVAMHGNLAIVAAAADDTGGTDAGQVYVFDVTTGQLLRTLSAPTAEAGDLFGASVALLNDNVVIGAPGKGVSGNAKVGQTIVMSAATGALVATISNPSADANDEFGAAVAVSSAGIIVGAPLDDTYSNNWGLAHLFTAGGAFTHTLVNPTDVTTDRFGAALVIAGDYYIVGMPGDDTHFRNSGKVRAYSIASGALIREFFSPVPALNDNFGSALAISGNLLAIGAPSEAGASATGGEVFVFDFTTGSLVRTLANPTPEVGDLFGGRLDWEGNQLVVSAMSDNAPNPDSGSVHLFDSDTGGLLRTFSNPDFANDQFGASVAISGNRLAVGMQIGVNEGKAFVFNVDTGVRTLTITDPQPAPQNRFGFALDLEGDNLVVGAPSVANAGRAYAFNAATGALLSWLSPVLSGSGYQFGNAVAISGTRVLIGDNPTVAGVVSHAHLFSVGTYTVLDSFPLPAAGAGLGETAVAISGSQLGIATTDVTAIVTMPGAGYLYNRQTLTAALTTGSLVIDTTGVNDVVDNNIHVVREGNDLLITDSGEFFTSAPSGGSLENQGRTLRVPFAALTSLTIRTNAGNDSLTVDWSGGDVIPAGGLSYQGGTQTNTLSFVGGPQGDVTYSQSSTTAGMVEFADFGTLIYTGLASLVNSGEVTNATIKLRAGTANLQDDGTFSSGNGLSKVVLSTMVNLVFASPSNTLNIIPNGNNNSILCYSLPDLTSNLVIGTDTDRVGSLNFAGLELAPDRNLTAYANSTITISGENGIRLSGHGNLSLITSRAINIFGPTSTVDGNMLLSANQQPVSASGSGASIYVHTGTVVESTGTGNVTVLGRGRTSVSDNNHGVHLYGSGTLLRAATGSVTVSGEGGGSGLAAANHGVLIEAGAKIRGGTIGGLTVDGIGGGSTSTVGGNHGVYVTGTGSWLTSSGEGNVVVRGTGGLTSTMASAGVMVFGFSLIAANGSGNVTVEGRGSTLPTATGNGHRGVVVDSGNITAGLGNINVRGWGGGVGASSGNNIGVLVRDSNSVQLPRIITSSLARATVEGTGGNASAASGDNNHGILLEDQSGIFAGTIVVTGRGGGSPASVNNTGVRVTDGSQIVGATDTSVEGTGGGGINAHGVEVTGGQINSTAGLARVIGTTQPAVGNFGIHVHSGGLLGAFNSLGTLELVTDALQLAGPASVQLGVNQTATIRPFTPGLPIHLGGDDVPGAALGLSSSELNAISGPALLIGNANSGDIVLVDQVTRTVPGNVSLTAGANHMLDLGAHSFTVPAAGQVSFTTSGLGSVATGDRLGTDVAAAQLNLTAGSALGVRVGSATLFDQLSVAGLVKLGGAGLFPSLHLRPYGTYLPVTGGTLVIVQNDGSDPIDGRVVAGAGSSQPAGTVLTEGMVVSDNLFGTGLIATISYLGGSGNDIVLHLAAFPRETATARVIDNQLIVTGTTASDAILVSRVGQQVRVRVGNRILGQFANPLGIVIDGLSGDDYVYVAPQLPATIVTTEDAPLIAALDAIYGGDNTQVEPLAPPPANYDHVVRDAALLLLLGEWIAEYNQLFPGGTTNLSVRRR